jgi:hypothetical protein
MFATGPVRIDWLQHNNNNNNNNNSDNQAGMHVGSWCAGAPGVYVQLLVLMRCNKEL